MDRHKSSLALVAASLLCAAALLAIVLAGILSTKDATDKVRDITVQIDQNGVRNECARQVSADLDERFRKNLSTFLDFLIHRDEPNIEAVVRKMRDQPNAAAEIVRRCGPVLTKRP